MVVFRRYVEEVLLKTRELWLKFNNSKKFKILYHFCLFFVLLILIHVCFRIVLKDAPGTIILHNFEALCYKIFNDALKNSLGFYVNFSNFFCLDC